MLLRAKDVQSYGIFLAHYLSDNTFPGATALDYAFVGGLSISLALGTLSELMVPVVDVLLQSSLN